MVFYFILMDRMIARSNCESHSFAGEVAVSSGVVGVSKGCHEVFRTLGEPEIVFPSGNGNL